MSRTTGGERRRELYQDVRYDGVEDKGMMRGIVDLVRRNLVVAGILAFGAAAYVAATEVNTIKVRGATHGGRLIPEAVSAKAETSGPLAMVRNAVEEVFVRGQGVADRVTAYIEQMQAGGNGKAGVEVAGKE